MLLRLIRNYCINSQFYEIPQCNTGSNSYDCPQHIFCEEIRISQCLAQNFLSLGSLYNENNDSYKINTVQTINTVK